MNQLKQSTPEPGDLCEGCRKPNAWMLIDPIYTYVCGSCAESGTADVCFTVGMYFGFRLCTCGTRVMVNSFREGKAKCPCCPNELFLGGESP